MEGRADLLRRRDFSSDSYRGPIHLELLDDGVRFACPLDHDRGGSRVSVVDDGNGFDLRAATHRDAIAVEIAAIKERARMASDKVSVWSRPGSGTRIELWLPV